jgi:hypothetical protein
MFWKKKGKGANKEQHPNGDKVNIKALAEYYGIVVVEATYLHDPNTQHPTKQGGGRSLWELLHEGKPTGWGKIKPQVLYTKSPPVSAEERAKIEAEKQEKARLHEESAKLSGIPITREDIDTYLKSRWSQGDHLVYDLNHRGDKGAEDTVSVWVHCDPANRFEKIEFTEALEATNPGLFHNVFIDDENGYWGWDDTLISFTGASGTRFTVSCYKIRRGDFYVHMGAGLHGGKAPITAENFKELDAVVETFRYLNSLPTTPPPESDNYSD